jgi:hypothetical protein
MSEIINAVVIVAAIAGSGFIAKKALDEVRVAALTKAAQGLPSLSAYTKKLTAKPVKKEKSETP